MFGEPETDMERSERTGILTTLTPPRKAFLTLPTRPVDAFSETQSFGLLGDLEYEKISAA